MRLRKTVFLPNLILILILAAGCIQVTNEVVTPSLGSSVFPTMTPTLTLNPTNTSTIVPTLPAEGAWTKLLELLANNGGCRLPCLWGITPGKSTYKEAQAILTPLRSISDPLT